VGGSAACCESSEYCLVLGINSQFKVGKVREQNLAKDLLKKLFDEYQRDSFNQPVTH
jgi:hypothetical protein